MMWLFYFFFLISPLAAMPTFQGLAGRPLDLLSLFLPESPTIFVTKGHEEELLQYWPKSKILLSDSIAKEPVDLLRIHLDEIEDVQLLPLSSAKALYLEAFLYPYQGTAPFLALKKELEKRGFFLLRRWGKEGAQISAVFVKTNYFYNLEMANYLERHPITENNYHIYNLVVFYASYGPIRYLLDEDETDSVKQTLKTGYAYEGNLSLMIHALTKPHSLAIDIGAHIGVHTIFMSRKTGPYGAVISFEPNKKLYQEHLANMELNGCNNVIPICKGLGDTHKIAYQRNIEIEQNHPIKGEGEFIDIVPLDSYYFNNVSLIKMDVENYEYFVLQGAKETLLRNRPVILFECWIGHDYIARDRKEQRKNFERVMELLESYGYDVHIIYNCDFLAIPKETTDELLLKYKRQYKLLDPQNYEGESA
jgi:FkbM family methyltransferase